MLHPFNLRWLQRKPFFSSHGDSLLNLALIGTCHIGRRFNAAHGNVQVTYFVNSGSEANDLALRIASCAAPGAMHVAIMAGAYHGHTKAIIDLSPYKYDGPGGEGQQPHVHVLPCPDPYRCPSLVLQSSALCFQERVTILIASSCRDEPNMQREL